MIRHLDHNSIEELKPKIVFTNGVFDILHRGHLELLRLAKSFGDILIVGINSDESVKRLKGPTRPVNNEYDRAFFLESLDFVDKVIIFNEDTPLKLIMTLCPNVLVKGGDYKLEDVVGNDIVPETIIVPLRGGYSTTNIIKKIKREI